MIDFRYHLVSLVSVFLALAVGIVLGAGPLKGTISDQLSKQVEQLRQDNLDVHTQLGTALNGMQNRDTFTTTVMPGLVAQQLGGTSVVLVKLPGTNSDAVKPLTQALAAAGATVTGQIDVKDAWTDPAKAKDREAAVRTLSPVAAQASPSGTVTPVGAAGPGTPAPPVVVATPSPTASVSGADRTGSTLAALLARAVVTQELTPAGPLDPVARTLLDGLKKAGLIDTAGEVTARATEAVLLVPGVDTQGGNQPSPTPSGIDPLADWAALGVGLDARSDGAVAVGPASSATGGGVLAEIRGQPAAAKAISTVDTGGTPMGDITTVLALREQSLGGVGSYGFVGKVDGPLPARPGTVKP